MKAIILLFVIFIFSFFMNCENTEKDEPCMDALKSFLFCSESNVCQDPVYEPIVILNVIRCVKKN